MKPPLIPSDRRPSVFVGRRSAVALMLILHPFLAVPGTAPCEEASSLSPAEITSLNAAIEQAGGRLRYGSDGQPLAIDLASGRGSADPQAFRAALSCPALKIFHARVGQIDAEDLAKIAALTSLEELLLQDGKVNDEHLKQFAKSLSRLRRLTLRNMPRVTDAGIAALAGQSNLTDVRLIDMQISSRAMSALARLPSLVALDLRMCKNIQDDGLTALKAASRLRGLKLGNYAIDDETLAIVADLPRLESLTIEDASITVEGIKRLGQHKLTSPHLRSLAFARCASLDDDALRHLASFPNLRRLSLRDVPVTGSFLKALPTLGQLELLSLNETFLGADAFEALAACRKLKRLELAQSFLPTEALHTLGTLSDLEYLNLSACGLNDRMLESLAGLRKLQTLVVDNNPDISPEAVDRLLRSKQ